MLVINKPDILSYLKSKDRDILGPEEAKEHKIRPLRMGVLNIMPQDAIKVTEKQFGIPVHNGSKFTKVEAFYIKLDGVDYGEMQDYVDENYYTIEEAKELGLDCVIVSGANAINADLSEETFYEPLSDFIKWTNENVTSTLYSCLASHIYMQVVHDEKRSPVEENNVRKKVHGNYEHQVSNIFHPITDRLSKVFNMAHSRWNEITWQQYQKHDMKILAHSNEAGTLLATSPDGLRAILLQGHPEYDDVSLLKEYVRDVISNRKKEISHIEFKYPPLPHNYLMEQGTKLLDKFISDIKDGVYDNKINNNEKVSMPKGMEKHIIDNFVIDRGHSVSDNIFSNWINIVFKTTNYEHFEPLMDHLDKDNPLNLSEPRYIPHAEPNSLFSEISCYA